MAKELKDLTKRADNYSQWYNDLVVKADLAEQSAVRGCMVIKPYGYAIWEKMQRQLDDMFKATGHVNAYFPLLIPKSFLSREAEHVEGFAKECAVVTHYRLKNAADGSGVVVDPSAKLEEELIIRPTSETIIWNTYKNWIQSYRDLPILCNQWANVFRWEMRTRLFLRTAEFLWQEGHTAHATREEAETEARRMLDVYADFAENFMAVPVVKGVKSANERFAGALDTYTIEAMMQDGKALQSGTSHFLGQNFAKAFDVQFINKNNELEYVWATSWGVSTRLMGALIMTHSDDNGLVLPPKLAPIQVVIIPIYKNAEQLQAIDAKANEIADKLRAMGISVKYDNADNKRPGFKFADYELKGVPVRLVMGGRDLENGTVEVMRRDTLEKETMSVENIEQVVKTLLDEIQANIFQKALKYRQEHTITVDSYDEFKEKIEEGGFILAHWDGTTETEERIKEETKATIRCIPFDGDTTPGVCMVTFLIAPAYQLLDNNLVERWTEYVKNGGHLILTCRTGQKDRDAKLWEAPLAAPIHQLAGINSLYYDHLPHSLYGKVDFGSEEYAWNNWADVLTPAAGTDVWAVYADQFYKGAASVIHRRLGKGTVTYIGTDTDDGKLEKEVVRRVYTEAGVPTEDLPYGVVKEWRDGFYIALNYTSDIQEIAIPDEAEILIGSARLEPAGVVVWKEQSDDRHK